jgi:FkbM family methyltransferase
VGRWDGDPELHPSMLTHLRSWIATRKPVRLRSGAGEGLRFVVGPGNPEYGIGTNELPVQDLLAAVLRQGDVFLDIGANVGFFTVIAARLVGVSGSVVAFEPVPSNAALIRRNARINGFWNVAVHEAAASSTAGKAELILAEFAGGASLASVGSPPDASGRMEVRTITVDGLIAAGLIPAPSLVKIDVEGAEHEVLLGMRETLKRCRPNLLLEFDGCTVLEVEEKVGRSSELLESLGYRIRTMPESYQTSWIVRHVYAEPSVV